jgi:dihydropteroate synthase
MVNGQLSFMRQHYTWTLPRTNIQLGDRTAIMGILNVTPDSFSDGGLFFELDAAIARGKELEQQGADIVDIGGESTRPGSDRISEEEETRRVVPVIEALARGLKIPISVDTYRAGVARRAVEAGAQIINDISGLRFDNELPRLIAMTGAGVVLMHSRGERSEIHRQPSVVDPVQVVFDGLQESVETARIAGIPDRAIVIDPGIGFSKDAQASLAVLKNLGVFSRMPYPLLVGTSRKSFIRAIIQDSSDSRLLGTAATVAGATTGGAHIVRVHDVREMRVVTDVVDRILLA